MDKNLLENLHYENILTETVKCDIIKKTNHNKRNQLAAEDVGFFMLFRGEFHG